MTRLAAAPELPEFITRAAGAAPDFARPFEPEPEPEPQVVLPPAYVEPTPRVRRAQLDLDTAIEINRRNTPQGVKDQRSASRYSLSEINSLSIEQVRDRLQAARPGDNRPTWLKFLDIIDAPRNFVAKNLSETFLPEAKRAALERGEFDQFGQAKVYGADVLRAIGIENRVVNAVGGLALDIFTDPISYIGAPIGAVKSVGTGARAITLSTHGGRTLRGAIKAASKGKTIGDDVARDVVEKHLAYGRVSGELAEETPEAIEAYLSKTIYGDRGTVSRTLSKAGLGGRTKGGTLIEDIFESADDAAGAGVEAIEQARQARIAATRAFVAKHTNNPGVNLSKGKGGAEIAHIPFTTKSLTVPGFGLGGMHFGRDKIVQHAMASAALGKANQGAMMIRAHDELAEISRISKEIGDIYDESVTAERAGADLGTEFYERSAAAQTELADWIDRAQQRRVVDASELNEIEDVGELLATTRMLDLANAELRKARAAIEQRDAANAIGRFSLEDIGQARAFKKIVVSDASNKLGVDADTVYDALANPARADQELVNVIEARLRSGTERVQALARLSDENLDLAEQSVNSLHQVMDASAEIASLRGLELRNVIGGENKLLSMVASRAMGIDDATIGAMPLAPLERALRNIAPDWATWISERSKGIGVNFGGVNGTAQSTLQHIRRHASGADDAGTKLAVDFVNGQGRFSKGLRQIAKDAGYKDAKQFDRLAQIVTAKVEVAAREASGLPKIVLKGGSDSPAARFLDDAVKDGFLADKQLQADIDQLANEAAEYLRELGEDMIARGEIDDLITAYLPVRLASDGEARARKLRALGKSESAAAADRAGASALDPTQARVTNLVEFEDNAGNTRRFLLLENDVWRGMDDTQIQRLAQEDPQAAQRVRELQDDFKAFDEAFAGEGVDTDEAMRLVSRPLLPFELNEYASTHALDGLVGGPLVSGNDLFETSMMGLLYHRTRSARIAEAQDAFKEMVEPFVLMNIRGNEHRALRPGTAAQMVDGSQIERMADGRYIHGGTVYRHMGDTDFDKDSLFIPEILMGEDARDALVPEQLVVAMERMNQVVTPPSMPALMRMADKTTTLFKISTLAHPSWFVGNVVGNTILFAMDVPDLITSPRRAAQFGRLSKEAARALSGHNLRNVDLNRTIMVQGRPQRIGDLLEMAQEGGVVTGGGIAGDLVRQTIGRQAQRVAPTSAGAEALTFGQRIRTGIGDAYTAELSRLARNRASDAPASRIDQIRAGVAAGDTGALNKAVSAYFGLNGSVDDAYRFAHFLMMLDDGMDPVAAAERTRRALLNYGDMSAMERNYIRPLVPFYAWTRASLPNFLMRTIQQPQHLASAPKLVTAIEEAMVGEDRVPRWQRPSWLNETVAVQVATDPETSILLGTLLPQEGAVQTIAGVAGAAGALTGIPTGFDGGDMMDTINWLFAQTAPAVKVPTELGFGRESFTGREIGADAGSGDISLNDYLLGQVRALRELGIGMDRKGGLERAFERGVGSGITRSIIGGRASDALVPERRELAFSFELREREAELRKAIKRQEADPEKQDELRVELLSLYRIHILRGGDAEDVPKWAREELEDLGVLGQPE